MARSAWYGETAAETLHRRMEHLCRDAFIVLGFDPALAVVQRSDRPDLADFQCNGAFALAKGARRRPLDIAGDIVVELKNNSLLAEAAVAAPGFINLRPSAAALLASLRFISDHPHSGYLPPLDPHRLLIDYGGPNVAKPLHVGHLRPAVIGDALRRTFHYAGYDITGDIHLGDWGTQMGMLITEVKRRLPDLPYFQDGDQSPYPDISPVTVTQLEGLYPTAVARCKDSLADMEEARQATVELQAGRPGYRALWEHFVRISFDELQSDYDSLDVSFDLWYGESRYQSRIPGMLAELKQRGIVVESQSAQVIDVARPEDKSALPPFLVQKSDGGYAYATTDLATLVERVENEAYDWLIYVVDRRQRLHFEQLFRAARRIFPEDALRYDFVGNGTMNGPDGKPFKTRAGGVIRLRTLLAHATKLAAQRLADIPLNDKEQWQAANGEIAHMVGVGAVKFSDLSHACQADYIFDLDQVVSFEGHTGPYCQYAYVRARAILAKAAERGFAPGELMAPGESERDLYLMLNQFPEALDDAIRELEPQKLADHAYAVASAFAQFYSRCSILREEDVLRRESWLKLVEVTAVQLRTTLDLLGIAAPDHM
jgi:arginyl-tRNA synthetase